ncbi:ABC transporter substrate-binding protein [Larkinella bovis]|uniref:ABC transporter substrate-binding protein n=1 Tax=Larkinella bovis TaxID=683041 RepID=A0ABW0I5F2_9BACT
MNKTRDFQVLSKEVLSLWQGMSFDRKNTEWNFQSYRLILFFWTRPSDKSEKMDSLRPSMPATPPQRIVSVVPSQTELLFDLGLDREIAGVTKFCIHPAEKVKQKPKVGGTKTLDLHRIHALKPDLILANREENTREQIEVLQRSYPVLVTDVTTIADALAMIQVVGTAVGCGPEAGQVVQRITAAFQQGGFEICNRVASDVQVEAGNSVAYLIWRKPYMIAARQTFIHSVLETGGFRNAFADQTRYPVISENELKAARPDYLFLSSEPYPFSEKHRAELQAVCPDARVVLVDGELFSWYGSRMLHLPAYIQALRRTIGLA